MLQIIWRIGAQQPENIRKMAAVQFIEIAIIGGMVFRAVPPVPIASFCYQEFLIGELLIAIGDIVGLTRVEVASFSEIIPRQIVFGSADPDVEVRVDPRTWHQ